MACPDSIPYVHGRTPVETPRLRAMVNAGTNNTTVSLRPITASEIQAWLSLGAKVAAPEPW